jgi:hypothetical protein
MQNRVSRKIEYADRVALQQADQAIRKDVVRALVELATNSNDSYQRLEDAGRESKGVIIIEIQRRINKSTLRVRDFAEGMDGEGMDKMVGTYGAETSGFREGQSVRGLWGRGLKDSIYGLGYGSIYSIRENMFNSCSLLIKDGIPMYEREPAIRATRAIRKQYATPTSNSTTIDISVTREDVRMPLFDNLRRSLERHFELRTILSNPKRSIVLRELDGRNKVRHEYRLVHKSPVGVKVLDEVFEIPNFPSTAKIEVFRSDVPLSTPGEESEYADGGLLVISKHVVLALSLFKYENDENASRFYGSVTCDYIHELLNKEVAEPVLTATRDGINWKHPFSSALKQAVEKRLEPLVEEERRRAQSEERNALNKKLRDRLNQALKELNSIANQELGIGEGIEGIGDSQNKLPYVPPSGFGFVPEYAHVQTGRAAGLILRASVPDRLPDGTLVTIESDSPEVTVLTPQVVIREREDFPRVGQARVEIEGRQVGAEAVVTARLEGLFDVAKAEALIKVVSKREHRVEPPNAKKTGGLFRDVRFDPTAEPKQRVRFDRATATIVIATQAPSVASYFDETGKGIETPQGQVMLAELITEAICREIARRGVESGNFLAPVGAESDAMQREYIRLQNQYAHRVHSCFVQSTHRRNATIGGRKGRLSRDESLSRVVVEV